MAGGHAARVAEHDEWAAHALRVVLRAHRRKALTEVCSCSTPDRPQRWSEDHVVDAAILAGVLPRRHTRSA